jgi:DNA mismatch repair protein MutL
MVEIAGGKIVRVEDAGLPVGTTIAVRDLFYNTPARRKFLRSEQTELGHIAALVTHYALAHPERHFELHSSTQALLIAPAVATSGDRLFQIFGRETAALMLPVTAEIDFARAGLPEPPPWKREADYAPAEPGFLRLSGFVSKPELQKLNRNSVYIFVNQRLVRDRVVLHALAEAYRNIIPPTSFPVVLLFLEMPPQEVDVNVHPAKTEVRFRQSGFVHDFIRDSVRTTLMTARPAASFAVALGEMHGGVGISQASSSLLLDVSPMPGAPEDVVYAPREVAETGMVAESEGAPSADDVERFTLRAPVAPQSVGRFAFGDQGIAVGYEAEESAAGAGSSCGSEGAYVAGAGASGVDAAEGSSGSGADGTLNALATLKPLGQLRDSFILAANDEGLWIIDQHVAHERVLFEKILRAREVEQVQRQRLLMPLLVDLLPAQMVSFASIARELDLNGFEAEPFGPRTLAIKAAPVGLEGRELERMLEEVLAVPEREQQQENAEARRRRIAASIACHAAIKINMPLEPTKIAWLLAELAKTEHPMSCPHGRPIALRYSHKDIQRAFQRI